MFKSELREHDHICPRLPQERTTWKKFHWPENWKLGRQIRWTLRVAVSLQWCLVDMNISRPSHRMCHMHNSETVSSSMSLGKRFGFLCNTTETAFVWERVGVTPFSTGNHQRHKSLSWSRYRTRGHYEQL